jgi:hypothetical protein
MVCMEGSMGVRVNFRPSSVWPFLAGTRGVGWAPARLNTGNHGNVLLSNKSSGDITER